MEYPENNESALQIYNRATKHEQNGEIQLALKLYKKALRLDPHVEALFQNTTNAAEKDSNAQVVSTQNRRKTTKSEKLPMLEKELMIQIFKWMIHLNQCSVLEVSLVCKSFADIVKDNIIWKSICLSNDASRFAVDMDIIWQQKWCKTPHMRTDGVYIANCEYLKKGISIDSSIQPFQLVKYYRYIRFIPGTREGSRWCQLINTSASPNDVIPKLNTALKGLKTVKWKWVDFDTIEISWIENGSNNCKLSIRSRRDGGICTKLVWSKIRIYIGDYLVVMNNDDTWSYPLDELKPFFFSRVKSYRALFEKS